MDLTSAYVETATHQLTRVRTNLRAANPWPQHISWPAFASALLIGEVAGIWSVLNLVSLLSSPGHTLAFRVMFTAGLVTLVHVLEIRWLNTRMEAPAHRSVLPARTWPIEVGDAPIGVHLGLLPQIHGSHISADLPTALWLIPDGVDVRIAYTTKSGARRGAEGRITDHLSGGAIHIGAFLIDCAHVVELAIVRDERPEQDCPEHRTPRLLPSPATPQPATGTVPDDPQDQA
jgi:uncharacterized protein YhhL (DUF1145 family)